MQIALDISFYSGHLQDVIDQMKRLKGFPEDGTGGVTREFLVILANLPHWIDGGRYL